MPKSSIKVCAQTCQTDDDCALWTGALPYRCHPTSKRCVECLTKQDCAFKASVWTYPCTVGGDECVDAYEACVDIGGGAGRCAERTTEAGDCAFGGSVPEPWPALDGSGDVSVCIDRTESCSANNVCLFAVTAAGDCTKDGCDAFGGVGRIDCDTASKRCICNATSCAVTGYSKCLPDGTCGCAGDNECTASPAAPTCYPDGRCGCSDPDQCKDTSRFEKDSAACVDSPVYYPW